MSRPPGPEPVPPGDDPDATAAMLRRMAEVGPLWVDVRGSSMGRSIPDGTRVRVEPGRHPRRGEVWVFCDESGVVLVHRARGEAPGDGYRFQGDTRVRADAVVRPARLVGRVVEVSPHRARLRWGRAAAATQRVPRAVWAWAHRRGARPGRG